MNKKGQKKKGGKVYGQTELELICVRVTGDILFLPMRQKHIHWVSCERNSSYNFRGIFLELYRCFCQGLKMCMTFGCSPLINFCYIFCSLNLVFFGQTSSKEYIYTGYLVNATYPTILVGSF